MKKPATTNASPRRSRAVVSVLGTTQLHLRNPFVITAWSFLFPGLGHLLLSKYIRGFLLFIWEIVINVEAKINEGIYYSFTGDFAKAISVVNIRWVILYIPTFLFAAWDSYRTCVDLNKNFVLAVREDAEVKPFSINAVEINYLDKSSPWLAFMWSLMTPGAGQLIIHRIVAAFFILIWWIVVMYFSKLLPAIHYSLTGQFDGAKAVLDKQWLLNVPSLYFFAIYDAYINTVESNKLYDWEQAKFLRKDYQDARFPMPLKKMEKSDQMYVVSSFELAEDLEQALTAIQMKGIAKEDIFAVPMDKKSEKAMLFDSMHASDSLSLLDLPMLLAAVLTLLGAIYGFMLAWGPILWGLIGMGSGFGVGLVIKLLITKQKRIKKNKSSAEVVVIVSCAEGQVEMVRETLWANSALGVSKLSLE